MDKLEFDTDIITERAHRAKKSKYGKKDTLCLIPPDIEILLIELNLRNKK